MLKHVPPLHDSQRYGTDGFLITSLLLSGQQPGNQRPAGRVRLQNTLSEIHSAVCIPNICQLFVHIGSVDGERNSLDGTVTQRHGSQ